MWSTRSAASMNDIDVDERRLRMGRRGDAARNLLPRAEPQPVSLFSGDR